MVNALEVLSSELSKLKGHGHTAIAIDPLINYIGELLNSARLTDPEGERQRIALNFEGQLEAYRAERSFNVEMFKAVIEAGQSALRALSIVNGAGAIAILAFLGNVLAHSTDTGLQVASFMTRAMTWFAVGVGFVALGYVARYFSQANYGGDFSQGEAIRRKWGDRWRFVAVVSAVASLLVFFVGIGTASLAILSVL